MTAPADLPCYGRQRTFLFDGRKDANYWRNVDSAKALCNICPVRQACLDRWLRMDEAGGLRDEIIVGGTTKAERDALRARACVGVAA